MRTYVLGAVLVMTIAVNAALAGDIGTMVSERCLGCHDMEKVCAVTSNDPVWWKGAVLRMVEYQADLLTPDEAETMGAFLADETQRKTLCK